MAKCPKCGHKLRLFNVSQFCPECKTNIRFFNFEENFYREAKKAELDNASFHIKMRHLKAAFIGSKLMIIRLISALLPAITMLLPAANYHYEIPFKAVDYSVGLLGLINLFSGIDLSYIFSMGGSQFAGDEFRIVIATLVSYLTVALFAVLVLLSSILCFISIKKMQKVICAFSACGILASIASLAIIYVNTGKLTEASVLSGSAGFGLYASMVAFAVVFAINFIIHKKGVPVEYDEGMAERAEIYKKVKSGEINIDDLPQPVVETAETKALEEEILQEEESLRKILKEREEATTA